MVWVDSAATQTQKPHNSSAAVASSATRMATEVQAVLQEASRAQEYEDEGDLGLALEAYYRAACQLSYFVDLHVEKGTALADLCEGLGQQYEQRATVLRSRQEAKGPHWLQLEQMTQAGPALHPGVTSSAGASATLDRRAMGQLPQQLRMDQMQQQTVLAAAAAGSGGLEQVCDEPSSLARPIGGNSGQLDLLNSCQRTVSGSLDDVVGLEEVKLELEEAVFLPLLHPHLFKGIRQPARTFLLYGPPGTGKTLLVEKVAAEAGFMLLSISPSMILSKWAGDSEKAISGVFDIAKSFQPCIIFLDEVDSLGQSRASSTDAGARRLLTELLIQFTKAVGEDGVYVFGATNRMQDCDPALLRRFSRRIEVPLPDSPAREDFFQTMLSRPELDSNLSTADISMLVQLTDGYSGSDLADLCRTAALTPVRELMKQQRLQHGRKRRRVGLGFGPPYSMCAGSRQSEESCATADSPPDSSVTDGLSAAEQQGTVLQGDSAASEAVPSCLDDGALEHAVQAQAGRAAEVQLRALMLSDFQSALELVKPAAVDAAVS